MVNALGSSTDDKLTAVGGGDKFGNKPFTALSRIEKVLVFRTIAGMNFGFVTTENFPGASILATADAASLISKGIQSSLTEFVALIFVFVVEMLWSKGMLVIELCTCSISSLDVGLHSMMTAFEKTLLAAAATLLSDELSSCDATSFEYFIPFILLYVVHDIY
eukprot:CAMPEP_0176499684 /NCGR_PEP_ID=MMETSP0200_2-20121128/13071_1 /TAXON_ID=947934 /ORGANISM="Chaetoceros sp., Strain GSL56" /LENGTH=162 /DNA_ID=CAMNT_0017898145 /DNA_START=133 /DNA_END=621 /DNA_ORIENTATION=-